VHDDEVKTSVGLVNRLVARQFPQWAGLPIQQLPLGGTDHALYRLGDELVARMPRIHWAADLAAKDARWLPVLAPHLPLSVPSPLAVGEPGFGYPFRWSVAPWLPGSNPSAGNTDLASTAGRLAEFIKALQRIDTTDAPAASRGKPLDPLDEPARAAIAKLGDRIDGPRVTAAWERALSAAPWRRDPVWVHGDLGPGNLLVRQGELTAVIDWGSAGVGDPAVDLMPAWSLFDAASRRLFRAAVGCDDDTWERSRGWALISSLMALPYYEKTFPAIVAESKRKIAAVLAD
jgi:aminoglycoside phosphotransferase (APT) family kinase protein